eukprot:3584898-Rhodomonas_salina.1
MYQKTLSEKDKQNLEKTLSQLVTGIGNEKKCKSVERFISKLPTLPSSVPSSDIPYHVFPSCTITKSTSSFSQSHSAVVSYIMMNASKLAADSGGKQYLKNFMRKTRPCASEKKHKMSEYALKRYLKHVAVADDCPKSPPKKEISTHFAHAKIGSKRVLPAVKVHMQSFTHVELSLDCAITEYMEKCGIPIDDKPVYDIQFAVLKCTSLSASRDATNVSMAKRKQIQQKLRVLLKSDAFKKRLPQHFPIKKSKEKLFNVICQQATMVDKRTELLKKNGARIE